MVEATLGSRIDKKGGFEAPNPQPAAADKGRPGNQENQDEEPVGHGELDLVGVAFPIHGLGEEGLSGSGRFVDPNLVSEFEML